jgi:hypothetical protein
MTGEAIVKPWVAEALAKIAKDMVQLVGKDSKAKVASHSDR